MKDKKGIGIIIVFQKGFNEFKPNPNKMSVDQGIKFYNRSIKKERKKKEKLFLMNNFSEFRRVRSTSI